MRIGFYTPHYPKLGKEGGIGTYTMHLSHALSALGHEVHVLTPGAPGAIFQDGPVTVHTAGVRYYPGLDRLIPGAGGCGRVNAAMRCLVEGRRLDVVEFPNWEGLGAWYSLWRTVPLVVRLSTSSLESLAIDGDTADRARKWDARRERWLARSADALVTHSECHRDRMTAELDVDGGRIEVLPLGVPVLPSFRRPPRDGDDLTVVYLGRLEKRKGTLDLLKAIPRVLREVPRARFVLIGADRPHRPGGGTHEEYVAREFPQELRGRVVFPGKLTDGEVDRHLQAADLFVSPSLYESFGLTFLEAMRWGTPVVGTRAGAIPEVVEDGVSGTLVPPGSPGDLAEAIISLLNDEGRRRQLGEAGRRRVEAHFTPECMARRASGLYERAVAAGRSGGGRRGGSAGRR